MDSRTGVFVAVGVLVVGLLALIVYSSMGLALVTGEICFTFNGRTECREASGTTRQEAIRTAAEMACSAMGNGDDAAHQLHAVGANSHLLEQRVAS